MRFAGGQGCGDVIDEIKTGGGASVGGNVEAGGDFSGRDRHEYRPEININYPNWDASIPPGQDRGRIPLEIEREFRAKFDKISERLEVNSLALGKLEATLDKNNLLTQQQIDTLKHNQATLEELARDTDAKIVNTLAGLHIIAAPSISDRPEPAWRGNARLVLQALTAVSALGLLIYFVMGG